MSPLNDDLCYQTVAELSRQIARKSLSPVELTKAYLDRTAALDPKLALVITLTREQALKAAADAEAEIKRGRVRSVLHGIPYGAKDLLDTKGIKTTWGSIVFKDRVPDRDATVIEKLTASGAVLIAKLTMSEFAGGSTRSNLVPFPHNPWKLDRTTFGSSSGPGAATAAGMVGFSIGSETGGSIVGPAANCGISGLRPTYGRVSRFGCMTLSWSLDKIGPMARSAVDVGLILEVIAGPDPKDFTANATPFKFRADPGKISGRKIGVVRHEFDLVNAANQPVFTKALDALKQAGFVLEDVVLPDRPYNEVYNLVCNAEAGTFFKPLYDDKRIDGMYSTDRRADWMAASLLPASDYITAQRVRAAITADVDAVLAHYTAVVAPTMGNGASRIEPATGGRAAGGGAAGAGAAGAGGGAAGGGGRGTNRGPGPVLTRLANITGIPGISIPCGFDGENLPLGLHIVARAWDEQAVLDVAMAYQRDTTFHLARPTFRD